MLPDVSHLVTAGAQARAAGGGGDVLRCCPVLGVRFQKTVASLLPAWHSSLRELGRDLNAHGNRGTRVLGWGEKNPQRNGGVGGVLHIFLRSCYSGGTFPTVTSVFPRPQQHAIPMGIGRRSEQLSCSALLLVWFPPECCLWKTTSSWQEISCCLKPLTLRKEKPRSCVCVLAQVREGLMGNHSLCDKMSSKKDYCKNSDFEQTCDVSQVGCSGDSFGHKCFLADILDQVHWLSINENQKILFRGSYVYLEEKSQSLCHLR